MKWIIIGIVLCIVLGSIGVYFYVRSNNIESPIGKTIDKIVEKPLEKYSFKNLKETSFTPSKIYIGKELKKGDTFVSYEFSYCMDKMFASDTVSGTKQNSPHCTPGTYVTGLINIPKEKGEYPVLVMYRGFVPREQYTPGEGTRRTAEEFARNGFITLAPDFLGYGGSDIGSTDSLEDRFQTYPTALTLLASIPSLNSALEDFSQAQLSITPTGTRKEVQDFEPITGVKADTEKVGIWGHSNGGHIALSTLAISGKNIPTVLWNPVTKPFPYSILYFTDEFDDEGKALRKVVADFEQNYDVFEYSPSKYYSWINAPIQLHQAIDDEAVPVRWSDQFVDSMEKEDKDVEYFKYPDENHNFNLGSWDKAMERSIDFYTDQFSDESQQ